MTTTITLPEPVATFFAAERTKDAELQLSCFAADGRVYDESHDHVGLEAIRAWRINAWETYDYTVEPLAESEDGETVMVHARLTGNFPGSPIEVDYRFGLRGGKIAALSID